MAVKLGIDVNGEAFYKSHISAAMRAAQAHAGKDGYVASLPQLLAGRVIAPKADVVWQNWYTANSEEDVGRTKAGNNVFVVVHGGGLLTPERIEQAYKEGLTPQYAAKFTSKEFQSVADGSVVPVFSFTDFKKGIKDLPQRYAIVMDYETVKSLPSGVQAIESLREDPLVIARAGGVEQAHAYLDRAGIIYDTTTLGNWHPLGINGFDADQPQGRLLFLGSLNDGGLGGDCSLGSIGRFVGVQAAEPLAARERIEGAPKEKPLEERIN